jgi:hypothetical protein
MDLRELGMFVGCLPLDRPAKLLAMENLRIAKAVTEAAGLDSLTLEGVWLTMHSVTELEEKDPCPMAALLVVWYLVFYQVELYHEVLTFARLGPLLPVPDAALAKEVLRLSFMARDIAREYRAKHVKKEEALRKIVTEHNATHAAAVAEALKFKRAPPSFENCLP